MLYNPARRDSGVDPGLVWSEMILAAFGLVMVYYGSIAMAEAERFTGFRSSYFLVRHSIYLAIGLAVAAALFRVPLWLWQRGAPWLFLAGTLLLVAVLIRGWGREVNGSRRWIPLGIASFQPSELMKLFVVLYAADYTVRKAAFMDDFRKGFLPMFGVMALIAALLLREPDFGALVVVTVIAMGILFLGGLNRVVFAGLPVYFAALVAQGIGVWLAVQAFINMGVNMGLLPTKGLTLPLLSFGGTGVVVTCMALAILLRIDWENRYLMRGGAL